MHFVFDESSGKPMKALMLDRFSEVKQSLRDIEDPLHEAGQITPSGQRSAAKNLRQVSASKRTSDSSSPTNNGKSQDRSS